MLTACRLRAGLLAVLIALIGAASAVAAEPPNQNDPCSAAGRDSCDNTGVGFYATYRYGIRWFGSYRDTVPGEGNVFCIDLRHWFPDERWDYVEFSSDGLRNRDGRSISTAAKRRMAYALWTWGRKGGPDQQAAVMLYVHALMGDAAPGEVDPAALNPRVQALYARIAKESAELHGPYRVKVALPRGLTVGVRARAEVTVVSASGKVVPNVRLALTGEGARGVPASASTGASGTASVPFTPATAEGVRVAVTATDLPSTLPQLYRPTRAPGARNAQRVSAPDSQEVRGAASAPVRRAVPRITTTATPSTLLVGAQSTDAVTVAGLAEGQAVRVTYRIHGPFRTREEIVCTGEPAAGGTFTTNGSGKLTTPPSTLSRPGWYGYQLIVPETSEVAGLVTPCGEASETFQVQVQPAVTTVVSATTITPGTALTDLVSVTGLVGESATVSAALYGPFETREAMRCDVPPVWSGSFTATGDGEYRTEPVVLGTPGYYTYRESIAAQGFVRPFETACAEVSETSIVTGAPAITTQVSRQRAAPGAEVTDTVVVTGLGKLTATVQAELWGPYPTREAMTCTGTPAWTGTLTATGDGTYTTAPVKLERAGYYTYREAIAGTEAFTPTQTPCGEATETTFVQARPKVTTVVSAQVARRGARIFDRVAVTGAGTTPLEIEAELFGPFATRDAITCSRARVWAGTVTASGDGTYTTARVTLEKAGFYTYRERIAGSDLVRPVETECALVAETALAAPAITTGRGEATRVVHATAPSAATPTRVRIPSLGVDAPVTPSGIDIAKAELGVPADIRRLGWWVDSATPGSSRGAVLIAGHKDSARAGAGAFFRIGQATAGERIEVRTRSGRTVAYRVTSVRAYPKADLPLDVFSTTGRARLVLVTCGGPFNAAEGFYRDNIVVTATPV